MNEITAYSDMIGQIKEILQSARLNVARQVNTELLTAYWNIGRIIEQPGAGRIWTADLARAVKGTDP